MASDTLTRDEARRRAALLGDIGYEVTLDLTRDGPTFRSETLLRFTCTEPGASGFVDLNAEAVAGIELNGEAVPSAAFSGTRVVLEGLAADNELRVVADCRYQHSGVGLHRFVDPVDDRVYLHTQFEPFDAHRVYACFDQPDLKGRFALTVDAPAEWVCVSNAAVDAVEPATPARDGARRWRFAETLPMSPYITALVAGPFTSVHDRHGDVDLGLFIRQSLVQHLDADEFFAITKQGFDFFTEAFGYPYPFGKYDQLFVPEFNAGAMENAGCVTFSETYVFRSRVTEAARMRRASTILHEMAHMWFGDLVTMRWWDDLWLNESFATYVGTLALAEATRFSSAWASFANGTKAWAYQQDQLPSTHPISADMVDTDSVWLNFDGITYAKGASVLKQLVAWVGRDRFLKGLRTYFRRHEYGNAELADFLAVLEESSGRELDSWSKQWLETTGVAVLRVETEVDRGIYRRVEVVQQAPVAHPTLRAHRMAVGLYDLLGGAHAGRQRLARRRRAELDVAGERTEVAELAGEPVADLVLPNDDDLTYCKLRLDERSLETLRGHLSDLDEPLARALCWGAAWDMTRDAELPTRRYVELVAEHTGNESDVSLLQTLLGQASAAIDRYGDPANRPAARARVAGAARRELDRAEPGGDEQLVWARCLASSVDDDDGLDWVRGLLDGRVKEPGLAVDTELRWHLVTRLAIAGRAGDGLLNAELERDPTDFGRRQAAGARAARPTAADKAAAWEALVGDPSLPMATIRALMSGRLQPGQDELVAGYVDPYVDALARIWAERDAEVALELTEGLYPSTLVDDRVVAAADRALASDLPAPAKRLLAEGRDGTVRALRARAADRD